MNKDILSLVFARLIMAFGYSVSFPFLSIYLYEVKNLSMSLIGSILGISTVFGVIGRILGGMLSDYFGSKNVLVYSFFIRSFIFLSISLIITFNMDYKLFIPLLILNSLFFSINMSNMDTLVAQLSKEEDRSFAYSINRVGVNLGWALGPAIGGIIATKSYSLLFFISFLATISSAIMLNLTVQNVRAVSKTFEFPIKEILDNKFFVLFSVFSMGFFITMSQLISTLSVYSTNYINISKSELGILYATNGLLVVFLQIPISNYIEKINEKKALIIGTFFYSIGYFSLGFAHNFYHLLISIIIITISEMFSVPSVQAIASILANKDRIGSFIGFFGLFQGLGWAIGPIIGGFAMDLFKFNYVLMWLFISCFSLTSCILFCYLFKKML
ncbi:MAG: MFS transporter [candidate division WOR-3 bacterium]